LSENQVNNVEWNEIEDCEVYLDLQDNDYIGIAEYEEYVG